jgi:hypothetical protein
MKNFITAYSKTWIILLLLVVFLIFNLFLFPTLMIQENPLDLKFSYTGQEAYALIEGYGEVGRNQYLTALIYLDFAYPIIYSLLFSLILFRLFQSYRLAQLPFLVLLADYLENLGTILMLSQYPEKFFMVGNVSGMFTTLKWILLIFIFAILIFGFIKNTIERKKAQIPKSNFK